MHVILTCITAFLLIALFDGAVQAAPPPAPAGFRWELNPKFTDEFNGASLDGTKWHDHHPRWQGRPPAKFMPSTLSVTNGTLRIRASMLPTPEGPFTMAGGAVVSRSEEAFHGYYEARMKASKISMSSTFWMSNRAQRENGATVSHEIDMTETVGAPQNGPAWSRDWNRFMNANTHYFHHRDGKKEDLSKSGKAPVDPPAGEAFHTYAAWWVDANTVRFYLDDKYQFTLTPRTNDSAAPFNRPMHVNLVVETYDWQPPPTSEELNDDMRNTTYYDWVRGYVLVKNDSPVESHNEVSTSTP